MTSSIDRRNFVAGSLGSLGSLATGLVAGFQHQVHAAGNAASHTWCRE